MNNNLNHIFKEIPEAKLNPKASLKENLQDDFKRIGAGVRIGEKAKLGNSITIGKQSIYWKPFIYNHWRENWRTLQDWAKSPF